MNTHRPVCHSFRPLRSILIGLVWLGCLVWTAAPAAAEETDGLRGEAALASGVYDPDLEGRLLADTVGAAFFFRGFGFHTPWRGKEFASIPLAFRFDAGRLRFSLESDSLGIRPAYAGYLQVNDFDYEGFDASLSSFRQIEFDRIRRDTTTARAALRLNGDPGRRRFHFILGGRSLHIRYDFSGRIFNDVDISQTFVSGGTPFSRTGEVTEIENVFDSTAEYLAVGGIWGFSYSEDLTDRLELRAGVEFHNLSGWARSRRQSLSIQSGAASFTDLSTNASATDSEDEIFYNLRTEDAKLFVNGNEAELGLYYAASVDLKVFARVRRTQAMVKDSEVHLLLFTTNRDADPYSNTINGEYVYLLDSRLTYPGSTAPESLRSLAFGIEKKF